MLDGSGFEWLEGVYGRYMMSIKDLNVFSNVRGKGKHRNAKGKGFQFCLR